MSSQSSPVPDNPTNQQKKQTKFHSSSLVRHLLKHVKLYKKILLVFHLRIVPLHSLVNLYDYYDLMGLVSRVVTSENATSGYGK